MATVETDLKDVAHRLVDRLPPKATWADLMYLIYVQQQIKEGIRAADEGQKVTTEELRRNLSLAT